MIADWHFTHCLRYPPRTAAVLFSLFDALDAPGSGAAAADALTELRKAESWAQVYAVPKALNAMARLGQTRNQAQRPLEDFLAALPLAGERAGELRKFCAQAHVPADTRVTLRRLREQVPQTSAAPLVNADLPAYFDLIDHADATLFAGVVESLARQPEMAALLGHEFTAQTDSRLKEFLEESLRGGWGRRAAGCVARALASADAASGRALAISLAGAFGPRPLDEPDYLHTAAELLLHGASRQVRECERETSEWQHYDQLHEALNASPHQQRTREAHWRAAVWRVGAMHDPAGFFETTAHWSIDRLDSHIMAVALQAVQALPPTAPASTRQCALRLLGGYAARIAPTRKAVTAIWGGQPLTPENVKALRGNWAGLIVFIQRRTHALAMGFGAGIAARDALDCLGAMHSAEPVAGAFVDWIQNAVMLQGANEAAEEWLGVFPQIAKHLGGRNAGRASDTRDILEKSFYPAHAPARPSKDWLAIAAKKDFGRLLARRHFLLAPAYWRDWADLARLFEVPEVQSNARVAAAVERALSIESDTPPALQEQWRRELADLLAAVTESNDLDRFVLLRVADLFGGAATGAPHLLQTALELIFQFGRPAHLRRVIEKIVDTPAVLGRHPELSRQLAAGLAERIAQSERETGAMSEPAERERLRRERRFLMDQLTWLLAGAGNRIAGAALRVLRDGFLERRRETLLPGLVPPLTAHLRVTGEERRRRLQPEDPARESFDPGAVQQAIEGPERDQIALIGAASVHVGRRYGRLLGVSGSGTALAINERGDLVEGLLNHQEDAAQLLAGQALDMGPPVSSLKPLFQEGAVAEVIVERKNHLLQLWLKPPYARKILDCNHDLWDVDIAAAYRGGQPEKHVVEATYENGKWHPLAADFAAWIARAQPAGGAGLPQAATFAFCAPAPGQNGTAAWIFAARAGENYEFAEQDFTPAALAALRAELHACGARANGLLVTLEATLADKKVRLTLAARPPESGYDGMEVPFDKRNVQWRNLFEGEETVVLARRAGPRTWVIAVRAPQPFPPDIHFRPDRFLAENIREAEAQLAERSPEKLRQGAAQGRFVYSYGLQTRNFSARHLFDLLSEMQRPGAAITIEGAQSDGEYDGFVGCSTPEGVRVQVAVESLSFVPPEIWEHRNISRPSRERRVRLHRPPWDGGDGIDLNLAPGDFAGLPAGLHEGFLTSVPERGVAGVRCEMVWEQDGAAILHPFDINNLDDVARGRWVGARVAIRVAPGGIISGTAKFMRARGTAMWRVERLAEAELGMVFLGTIGVLGSQNWFLCESAREPGLLLELAARDEPPAHLAIWQPATGWVNGPLPKTWQAFETAKRFELNGRFKSRLAPLLGERTGGLNEHVAQDWIISGWSDNRTDDGRVEVKEVGIRLVRGRADDLVIAERDFGVTAAVAAGTADEPEKPAARPDRAAILADLAAQPEPARCLVGKAGDSRTTVVHPEIRGEQAKVPIRLDRLARITENNYQAEGRALLVAMDDQAWEADFIGVRPYTLEELYYLLDPAASISAGNQSGEIQARKWATQECELEGFYFAGSVPNAPDGPSADDPAWLFEFGYGEAVVVPASRLRSNGGPLNLSRLIFFGDRVRKFLLVEITLPGDGGTALGLDLLDLEIQLEHSHARQLYVQATKHQVVHTLHLESVGERRRIVAIEGCGVGLPVKDAYKIARAEWDESKPVDAPRRQPPSAVSVAYGRLNTRAFEASQGRVVHFQRVMLSFTGEHALRKKEVVFLSVGGFDWSDSENDCFLRMKPLEGVDQSDVGGDFKHGVGVGRRSFSKREYLLRRMLADEEKFDQLLKGQVFAVRVEPNKKGNYVDGTLYERMPERRLTRLHGWLKSRSEPVFAVVFMSSPDSSHLSLELRPGIFFAMKEEAFDLSPEARRTGATVRLEALEGGRFAAHASSLATSEFFKQPLRPVVVLPLDPLLRAAGNADDDPAAVWQSLWEQRGPSFTVGDFPEVLCHPASRHEGEALAQTFPPNPTEWQALMEGAHPRIAWLSGLENNHAVLKPGGNILYGGLEPQPAGTGSAEFIPGRGCAAGRTSISWLSMSFAEISSEDLGALCRRSAGSWTYHDHSTVVWERGRGFFAELPEDHRAATGGPLFFEKRDGSPRLRYRPSNFFQYGLPLGDPIETLGSQPCSLHSAGAAVVEGKAVGLWAERAPGRLHLLPAELLSWSCEGQKIRREARFDFQQITAGDRLQVRAKRGDALEPGFVELLEWRQSLRALLGQNKALLPVARTDAAKGSMTLGQGLFELTLPAASRAEEGQACWLSGENELTPADLRRLTPGNAMPWSCLIGFDPEIRNLVVLGATGFRAVPDPDTNWARHPVGCAAVDPHTGRIRWAEIHRLVQALGVLPATAEHVDQEGKKIYFSLREQEPRLAPEHFCLAKVVGFDAAGNDAPAEIILWVGKGLWRRPFDQVIAGVSREMHSATAAALIDRRVPVAVRVDEKGQLSARLMEDKSGDQILQPVLVTEKTGDPACWGLVARSPHSAGLFWIGGEQAAFARMSAAAARSAFFSAADGSAPPLNGRVLPAAGGGHTASLIDTAAGRREEHELTLGAALRVVPDTGAADAAGIWRGLAKSPVTGLLLELRANASPTEELVQCTVDFRRQDGSERVIQVVPTAERHHFLALPASMNRADFNQILGWLEDAEDELAGNGDLAPLGTFGNLTERLCHVWVRARAGRESDGARTVLAVVSPNAWEEADLLVSLLVASALAFLEAQQPGSNGEPLLRALDELGRRALRSLHLEILAGARDCANPRARLLFARLEKLILPPLLPAKLVALRNWIRLSRLSFQPEVRVAGMALACALGGSSRHVVAACRGAEILRTIAGVRSAMLPILTAGPRHPPAPQAVLALATILETLVLQVKQRRMDWCLLASLPKVD